MTRQSGWERAAMIRPAILLGQRVDFWDADDWQPSVPGELPAAGFWLDKSSGRILVALDGHQSLLAVGEARRLERRLVLSLREARAAEAGRVLPWTSRLSPIPARIAARKRIRPGN